MKIMLETTVWDDPMVPNHVYVFNDSMTKAMAYVRAGTKELFRFKSPLSIDTRGRTFVELEDSELEQPDPDVIVRVGSKGEKYYISQDKSQGWQGWSCTCPGFKFRGSCKHVAEIQQDLYGRDPY